MLFIYSHFDDITYFEAPISSRVEIGKLKHGKPPNSYDFDIIVGNDIAVKVGKLLKYPAPSQTIIDVTMLGLTSKNLDEHGMDAVVHAYNNYYLPDDEVMRVDIPVAMEKVRDLPENYRESKIKLSFYDNSRFDVIRKELARARRTPGYVGASWPTCHYLASNYPLLLIYFGPHQIRFTTVEAKPINLILNE